MIAELALLAAGLVPPSNGARRVVPSDVPVINWEPIEWEPDAPKQPAKLRGWVPASRVTPTMRKWADRVLRLNERIGAFVVRRFGKTDVLARVEWHRHGDGPWHRGVSLYVRGAK